MMHHKENKHMTSYCVALDIYALILEMQKHAHAASASEKMRLFFHNVVHSPHIEPPIVSRKLGKLSFADEHRGPHIDKGRQLFHNFESNEIPNKHTASERRLPVVTSENAARKVPNTWKCPNFEPLTVMCSPVCSQEMGAAMTAPTFTYTHQPLYIVVICLIFSGVPM